MHKYICVCHTLMCLYICLCIFKHSSLCLYAYLLLYVVSVRCVRVCLSVHMPVFICIHAYMCLCTSVYTFLCIPVFMSVYVSISLWRYVCVHIYLSVLCMSVILCGSTIYQHMNLQCRHGHVHLPKQYRTFLSCAVPDALTGLPRGPHNPGSGSA
jgi:hypothetical protein